MKTLKLWFPLLGAKLNPLLPREEYLDFKKKWLKSLTHSTNNQLGGLRKKSRIIFLDIDGVIANTHRSHYLHKTTIDKEACMMLAKLISDSNAKLVISSTWRLGDSDNMDWFRLLQTMGLPAGSLYYHDDDWRTEPKHDNPRGDRIADWLAKHPEVTEYVIIDDDGDMLDWQMPNFVHVDAIEGFGMRNYNRAMAIFNGKEMGHDERPHTPIGCIDGMKSYRDWYADKVANEEEITADDINGH